MRALHDAVSASVRVLSVLPSDLPAAIERLQGDNKALSRAAKTVRGELAHFIAADLAGRAVGVGGCRLVVEVVGDQDAAGLKALGQGVAGRTRHVAVLVSSTSPVTVVVAVAEDTPLDAGSLVRRLAERFGGRGGGKPGLAQAGGLGGEAVVVAEAARALVEQDLG